MQNNKNLKVNKKSIKALNKLNHDLHDNSIDLGKRNEVYINDACEVAKYATAHSITDGPKTIYLINTGRSEFTTGSRSAVKKLAVDNNRISIKKIHHFSTLTDFQHAGLDFEDSIMARRPY